MKIKLIALVGLSLITVSCYKQKEMQIARSSMSVISDLENHSPIYITGDQDAIIVDRTSSIGSTNWVFSIDRDLNAQKVLLEVKKLKDKKYIGSMHPDKEGVYFSYMDTVHKNIAFMPFATINYTEQKLPEATVYLTYSGNGMFDFQGQSVTVEHLDFKNLKNTVVFNVTAELTFEAYLQAKVLLEKAGHTAYLSTQEALY